MPKSGELFKRAYSLEREYHNLLSAKCTISKELYFEGYTMLLLSKRLSEITDLLTKEPLKNYQSAAVESRFKYHSNQADEVASPKLQQRLFQHRAYLLRQEIIENRQKDDIPF